jgi:hypothetical protein
MRRPPLGRIPISSKQRAELRLYWRTYAATAPTAKRAWGMAAALGRYFAARGMRRGHDDGPIEPITPISRP